MTQHEITLSYPDLQFDGTRIIVMSLPLAPKNRLLLQLLIRQQLIESGAIPVKRIEAEKMR